MTKNGAFVNPLRDPVAAGGGVTADEENAFQAARDQQLALLVAPAETGYAVAEGEGSVPRGGVRTASGASP